MSVPGWVISPFRTKIQPFVVNIGKFHKLFLFLLYNCKKSGVCLTRPITLPPSRSFLYTFLWNYEKMPSPVSESQKWQKKLAKFGFIVYTYNR
ncbi:MAG: hypothetical protein DDT33_01497 [Firmicutes bacterium]|nr:hypothetical protein [Bacillota bacterium]